MALMPLTARQLLTKLTINFKMQLPTYQHETDLRGLTTVKVTIQVSRPNIPTLEKTFSSLPEDNCIIAEDIASRMALRFIQAYYAADNRVSSYLNSKVFIQTKKAWKTAADSLAHQLDVARDTIRHLHDQLYQTKVNRTNLSEKMNNNQMLEKMQTNTLLQELSNETVRQQCQIILLENRIHYIESVNSLLCTNQPSLLQLSMPQETSATMISNHPIIHGNTALAAAPLAAAHANLTEL